MVSFHDGRRASLAAAGMRGRAIAAIAAATLVAVLALAGTVPAGAAPERLQAMETTVGPAGGLLLDRGVFRPLPDVPGAQQTVHFRNNNRSEVVGLYADLSDGTPRLRGFLMRKRKVTRIDVPGAVSTLPLGINDRGEVVGGWVGPDAKVDPVDGETKPVHGFLWEKGRFKTFDIPGATTTAPYEINNRGEIVGNYADAAGAQHGFLLRRSGVTTIDHPRATDAPDKTGTRVVGIDDRGRLVGSYGDDAGTIRAWKWENGRFTTITRGARSFPRPARSTSAAGSSAATSTRRPSFAAS
jgi:hypothetical protein